MTCQQCGSQAHGDLCVDCRIDQAAQAADLDRGDDYECPDCGGETSGKDVVCYRCRDSHQDGDGDDSDGGEDDAADAGDGEEAVLVADGGQDVPQSGDDIRVYGRPATLLTRYEERSGVWFEDNNTKDWVETDAIEPVDAPELVTDGGEDVEPTERVERTDVGVSITAELTRGTGTRDQDKIKAKAKGETLEDARDDMDELKGYLRALAQECRAIQPAEDGDS